jgi:hypothetical protein
MKWSTSIAQGDIDDEHIGSRGLCAAAHRDDGTIYKIDDQSIRGKRITRSEYRHNVDAPR